MLLALLRWTVIGPAPALAAMGLSGARDWGWTGRCRWLEETTTAVTATLSGRRASLVARHLGSLMSPFLRLGSKSLERKGDLSRITQLTKGRVRI